MSNTNNGIALRSSTSLATGSISERLAAQKAQAAAPAAAPPVDTAPVSDAMAELARLRAENDALRSKLSSKSNGPSSLTVKIAEKGGVSIYGTGRFPVTVYGFNALKLFSPETIKNVKTTMAAGFGSMSFKTKEQRDTVAAALRAEGFTVSDESMTSARLTVDASE